MNDDLMMNALLPLAAIADAYDRNELDDDGARKFWGQPDDRPRQPFDTVELYAGRGGSRLLTLQHAFDARRAVETETGVREALAPLVAIANAFDSNDLDDEARKFWGRNLEHENTTPPAEIELYADGSGSRLLTLADALAARAACNATFFAG